MRDTPDALDVLIGREKMCVTKGHKNLLDVIVKETVKRLTVSTVA